LPRVPVKWGDALSSEHERWLCETVTKGALRVGRVTPSYSDAHLTLYSYVAPLPARRPAVRDGLPQGWWWSRSNVAEDLTGGRECVCWQGVKPFYM